MTKELTVSAEDFGTIQQLCQTFVASGLFADTKDINQAIVKVIAGRELNIPPFTAMRDLFIINGKVTMAAGQIASRIKSSGKYDFKVITSDDRVCILNFTQDGVEIGESKFGLEDAEKAGLLDKGGYMYKKYPKNMLFARALTNGARFYCADVFNGSIYTPEELGAEQKKDEDVSAIFRHSGVDIQVETAEVTPAPKTPTRAKEVKVEVVEEEAEEKPAKKKAKAESPTNLAPADDENDVESVSWKYRLSKGTKAGVAIGDITYNHLRNYLANHGKDISGEERLAINVVMERKKRLFLASKKLEEAEGNVEKEIPTLIVKQEPSAIVEVQKVFPAAKVIDATHPENLTYEELKTIKLLGGKHEGTPFEQVETDYLRAHLEKNKAAIDSKFPWYGVAITRFLALRIAEQEAKAAEFAEDVIE